nr:MAG TPA: hypothetical protein [Caudoviricetes sp.]
MIWIKFSYICLLAIERKSINGIAIIPDIILLKRKRILILPRW